MHYDDLPRPADRTGLPLAWGTWGPDDEIGTLNNISAATVAAAATEIRDGLRFSLNLPLDEPFGATHPGSHRRRAAPTPTLYTEESEGRVTRDDRLDGFFLQGSTQWDGLNHFADPEHGFYNHAPVESVRHGAGSRNGIEKALAHGIAGRAVLVDLASLPGWTPMGRMECTPDMLRACLPVPLRAGDILLIRTGWLAAFRASDLEGRDLLIRGQAGARDYSGLSGGEPMWRFLWEAGVAAVAADNPTVEAWPIFPWKPSLHLAIARLGLCLGEFFDLEALAAHSRATGRWTSFFTAAPLHHVGGIGSPGNALAIR